MTTNSPILSGAGEYGATTVALSEDGSTVRLSFGRNAPGGKVFYGAVLLSPEATRELREQLDRITPNE